MDKKKEIVISIRNLVEFILRNGDLDARYTGASRALEGTRAHQRIQKSQGEEYTAEVSLKHRIEHPGGYITVQGRADGIIKQEGKVLIDEIKTTAKPLEEIDDTYDLLHWAQAKCYGYIYALQNHLTGISIQLTYYQLDTEEIKRFIKHYEFEELELFFKDLIERYLEWANLIGDWHNRRDKSIQQMEFPFPIYRKGQRKLAVSVYKTIKEEKKIFIQAPTGIGKTISVLFPAIKAMGEGITEKIFYLTAKTITRQVAEEAFKKMKDKGLNFKALTLTAKEKICFEKDSSCNPEECSYAKGHFDRVNDAIRELFERENDFIRDTIEHYARKHNVCPFELSLDLALWADCVICDYNYVFDPSVYLRRFFQDNEGNYSFLVDEAHNLVDRARSMFSSGLYKKSILEIKRKMKGQNSALVKSLRKLNSFMVKEKKQCSEAGFAVQKEEPTEIYPLLREFISQADQWLIINEKTEVYEELLELYFQAVNFLKIAEFYDERYVTYRENGSQDFKIKLYCVDPSYLLGEAVKRGKAAVFFSATLLPSHFYHKMLGGGETDSTIQLPSPFERKNLCLIIAGSISTRYKDREHTYEEVAEYIMGAVQKKKGNYLVYFPSYKYMEGVHDCFRGKYASVKTITQTPSMSEEERELFLAAFQPDNLETMVGFAVLGGIFSEGIDLIGDRLVGTVIVGVGLPQICLETNIIREHFQQINNSGFEYAYMYPGMNKVLQAVGRVIRTENDRGIVLLMDDRFLTGRYQQIFPKEWFPFIRIKKPEELEGHIDNFWNKNC